MLQYNAHILKVSRELAEKQETKVKLAFEVIHGLKNDALEPVPPVYEDPYHDFWYCLSWLSKIVCHLCAPGAIEQLETVKMRVLETCRTKDFTIPTCMCMHFLCFNMGLIFADSEIADVMKHYGHDGSLAPKAGKPFIAVLISAFSNAPELKATHEFIAELSRLVRVKVYIIGGTDSPVSLGDAEVHGCSGMTDDEIAALVRSDNPALVLNGSAAALNITKLGVAPNVMQFIGIDVPVFCNEWINYRYLNRCQADNRLTNGSENQIIAETYHHMASDIAPLLPDTRRATDSVFRIATHFRDFKSSPRLSSLVNLVVDADPTVEVIVAVNDPTGRAMDLPHPRVKAGWLEMEDPNAFKEQFDLVIDAPLLWSMHHTMIVWMKAGVPIAVVRSPANSVFSSHSVDMLTMLGMQELIFETCEDLAARVGQWISTPTLYVEMRQRYEDAVAKIPSNEAVAQQFHAELVRAGLLITETAMPPDDDVYPSDELPRTTEATPPDLTRSSSSSEIRKSENVRTTAIPMVGGKSPYSALNASLIGITIAVAFLSSITAP